MKNIDKADYDKCSDILFVIVLYKVALHDAMTYKTLINAATFAKCGIDLLVYDNGNGQLSHDFKKTPHLRIIYVSDNKNSGVSKAYNTGAEFARQLSKKWLWLLDQDTQLPVNTITKYLKAIENFPSERLFAPIMRANRSKIISPCKFRFMRGTSVKNITGGLNSLNQYSIINCGMCIDLEAFHNNNGYNELLKLDFSDHDFIRRFKKNVTNKFVVVDLIIEHQLSSESKNTAVSDKVRFNYYLEAGKLLKSNLFEAFFIKCNALVHATKLSINHKTFYFVLRLLGL